ncbi:flagellar basal body rod protein FlgB [Simiduia curdlanivorans]|uniref:Flagellar basal body rod protein FlgB n=1 Tax=Simiduia curdlanivorans TaxID=1492769 RepID=A0ABV8V1H6_9GAMM|nr:flagellar basal body rod protein FlgB [Simiduia curdlanivorans]MDN3639963.1 flagellar basal body rod protein FlgB [Simiduia curdlanivorans]
MAISFQQATGFFETTLALKASRAELLANNLANADTPQFKARDFDFKAALSRELSGQKRSTFELENTQARHIEGQTITSLNDLLYRTPIQPSVDGNTVEEQIEHSAYMKNALGFQASFTMLNGKFKGLMTAIRGE